MTEGWDEQRARQERAEQEWLAAKRGCKRWLNLLLVLFALAAAGLWLVYFAIPGAP